MHLQAAFSEAMAHMCSHWHLVLLLLGRRSFVECDCICEDVLDLFEDDAQFQAVLIQSMQDLSWVQASRAMQVK